jgi:AraC-like DNA-binding protein
MTKKTTKPASDRTSLTPDEISQAHALREAGYTTLAISQRTGISVRTLTRHFAAAGTRKGAIKAAILKRAKDDLLSRIISDEAIREEAARLIADDLAHSRHLREVIYAASEHMVATNLEEAVQVNRAAAAYSTTIKNTSDLIRHSLRVEALSESSDELPELTIQELSQADIERIQREHAEQEEAKHDDPEMVA